jgi:hypothetical protein
MRELDETNWSNQMNIIVTYSHAAIPRFLTHIKTANVPVKVTNVYLKSVGFKSSNDSALIGIFKSLGFLDQAGVPTERWRSYRGDSATAKSALGEAIKSAYNGLFGLYPDAYLKDDETVANWVRANSALDQDGVSRAVRTFKVLCSEATFDRPAPSPVVDGSNLVDKPADAVLYRLELPLTNGKGIILMPLLEDNDKVVVKAAMKVIYGEDGS